MKINYNVTKTKIEEEPRSFDVKDRFFCFLKGKDGNGFPLFLGIWQNAQGTALNVVTMESLQIVLSSFEISNEIDRKTYISRLN